MPTRILLVEDNPGDAVIFREKLNASDLDYELVHVKRLAEGLRQLADDRFDILMVDLSLPDASGLEAVVQVREASPDRPLIVLTGLDDATAAAQAKQRGAVDYLVKWYVDSVSLARYIRYAIAQYRMFPSEVAAGDYEAVAAGAAPRAVEGRVVPGPPPEPVSEPAPPPAAEVAEDPLREALVAGAVGVAVVEDGGRVVFANRVARRWVGGEQAAYPWPLAVGRQRVERRGKPLEQRAVRTTWQGRPAFLVHLQEPEPAPETRPAEEDVLAGAARTALAFIERAQRQSEWTAGLLRAVLDLHRLETERIDLQPALHDLAELAQQAAREVRSLAMQRGLAVRVTASRQKVMARVDRNVAARLLRRLVADAVQTVEREGVRLRVELEPEGAVIRAEWERDPEHTDAAAEAGLQLGQEVVERFARLLGGTCRHEEDRSGHRAVTVRLPAGSPNGE